jgi:hypothetical protein
VPISFSLTGEGVAVSSIRMPAPGDGPVGQHVRPVLCRSDMAIAVAIFEASISVIR